MKTKYILTRYMIKLVCSTTNSLQTFREYNVIKAAYIMLRHTYHIFRFRPRTCEHGGCNCTCRSSYPSASSGKVVGNGKT
jgi:hypothetical protein